MAMTADQTGQLLSQLYQEAPFLEKHLLYLGYAGSRSYGTATAESDIDLRGIAFAPRETVFGLGTYEQTVLPEPDTVIYSLKKYVQLAAKANPNILELLFAERDQLLVCSSFGETLRERRQLFLSKRAFYSFGGYAIKNIRKLGGLDISYDTKDASHLIRLLQTGIELLETGAMEVKRPNHEELLAIKQGKWSLTELLAYAEELYSQLEWAFRKTDLPEQPDMAALERLVIGMNEAFYMRG